MLRIRALWPLSGHIYRGPRLPLATQEHLTPLTTYGCLGLSLATFGRPVLSLATCSCLGLSLATYRAPNLSLPTYLSPGLSFATCLCSPSPSIDYEYAWGGEGAALSSYCALTSPWLRLRVPGYVWEVLASHWLRTCALATHWMDNQPQCNADYPGALSRHHHEKTDKRRLIQSHTGGTRGRLARETTPIVSLYARTRAWYYSTTTP